MVTRHEVTADRCLTTGRSASFAMPRDVLVLRGDVLVVSHATGTGRYRVTSALHDLNKEADTFVHAEFMGLPGDRYVGEPEPKWWQRWLALWR